MKKEKTVKTYQRRTKSGKIVTVRQHTASYDAADKAKNAAKRKGAGKELEEVKSKKSLQKADLFDGYDFTKDDFNEWYEGTGSAADKKVAKALRKTLGRKAYNELNDLAADNYKKGGANSFFKKNVHSTATAKTGKSTNSGKSSSAKTENAKEKAAEAKTSKSKTTSAPTKKSNFEKYKISDLHDSVDSSNPNGNMGEYGFFPIKGPKNTLTYKHKETGEIYSTPANSDEWGKGKLYKSLDAFKSAVTTKSISKEPTKTSTTKSAKSSNDTTKSEASSTGSKDLKSQVKKLVEGLKGSGMTTYNKPARVISRKDGSVETNAWDVSMWESLRKAGWKNIDKVAVVGGTSNYVSPDGKYHAVVGMNKTIISPVRGKVTGHTWDSVMENLMGKDY